ncbi:acyltransferase family protein [Zavarzinella formosa]|uniref:acyltransferase family protein n=1 Tax=Zavarzinella formosa TaxID=360055 RepID=UPI0003139356|nr:acyltransferase [Zavarzinella formosa]
MLSAFMRYRATRTFGALNGLRGLSILAVISHHAAGHLEWLPMSHDERGFLGVDLFFVLSGFLIVTLLLREHDATGGISLRQFYIRRTLRIFPLYYAVLLLTLIIYGFQKSGPEVSAKFLRDLPFLASYTSNLVVLASATPLFVAWSLATEEQFYLIWPAVEKWLKGPMLAMVLVVLLAINQIINFRLANGLLESVFGPGWEGLLILQITFTPILLGTTLAHWLHHPRTFQWLNHLAGFRFASVLWGMALIAVLNIPQPDIQGLHRLVIQLLMTVLLASCVIREDHLLQPILKFRPLARLGVVSYGMYLIHMFVLPVSNGLLSKLHFERPEARFLMTTLLSWIAAEISFRFFEHRFLALKDRFTPNRDTRNVPVAPTTESIPS